MNDVAEFLAYAIKLEEDAAARFSDLAESMKTYGNREVAEFFGKMAHFSRLHLAEARKRAGFHTLPDMKPEDYKWPGDESPEATSMEGSHYLMTAEYALALALSSEENGYEFYQNVATTTKDVEIRTHGGGIRRGRGGARRRTEEVGQALRSRVRLFRLFRGWNRRRVVPSAGSSRARVIYAFRAA